ncbi:MAG: acyl-CoA dehydrogenase [Calditrichaeota bacterium]|nr:MAG: acyl-CoA dehydrogenase [Calditrichota bacterium]MBL1204957.1 acyl-CoA dehydrogenase [Calditrichota bacterium]NOG44787.1 acyl-CoA dehydrogenase [Calditrichota bacterium]
MGAGLDKETLNMILDSIKEFSAAELTDNKLIEIDEKDEFPIDIINQMCGEGLGLHLLFIPEEYGGLGGGAFDDYRVCEQLARVDLGISTGVFATFLGSDPIVFGGTDDQKKKWLSKIAEDGLLMAYGATEPAAGSDLGALKTIATPVEKKGKVVGYKINGTKQWISNGGYADLYTILAKTPGGPSWFVVEKEAEGFEKGKPEDKHGIRASNTAALSLDDVYVDADRLLGDVEGQGLFQAQLVFGYTRLMVAAFGLGAGWAAIDRAIPYSVDRIQGGTPLSEKQGYTHKLIIPHIVKLEASRAYIEETAERIDDGGGNLNTEGAIAKYMATVAGNEAAEASIQALGGYGYTKEYMVEKYKRDVRITTIYEGTSEIMEMTICRDRWQLHLKTRGQHYHDEAAKMEQLHNTNNNVGAATAALALHALAVVMERAREKRLTRNQHILFRLGELTAFAETAASFARRADNLASGKIIDKADARFKADMLSAMSRIFAREAALKVSEEGLRWIAGVGEISDADISGFESALNLSAIHKAQSGMITDMDYVADVIYERV